MARDSADESAANLAATQAKYADKSPLVRFANQRFFNAIDAMIAPLEVSSLLDAGCGEGVILNRLRNSIASPMVGVDLDPARTRMAQSALPGSRLGVANVQRTPFPSDSFDLVLLLEVLEHVGDPSAALDEVHRVCRRYLLASVPNEPWWRIGNMLRLKYLRDFGNTPEHIHHWSVWGFKRFIATRFAIRELRTPFLWTFVLAEKRS